MNYKPYGVDLIGGGGVEIFRNLFGMSEQADCFVLVSVPYLGVGKGDEIHGCHFIEEVWFGIVTESG